MITKSIESEQMKEDKKKDLKIQEDHQNFGRKLIISKQMFIMFLNFFSLFLFSPVITFSLGAKMFL